MPVTIDATRFPRVLIRWKGAVTDAEVQAHVAQMQAIVDRPERRVIIYDAREGLIPNAAQRQIVGAWLKKNDARIRDVTAGTAFVIDNALMRGALTAVFWIAPLSSQTLVCKTVEEAWIWADQRLGAALQQPGASR